MELLEKAKKHLKISDHIINITYKTIQEPKLLLAGLENLFLALTNSMTALLEIEKKYKRIPNYQDNFKSKFIIFKEITNKYKLNTDYIKLIQEVKEIIYHEKTSTMEFTREEKLIFCSNDYEMYQLTEKLMKTYITKAKLFIEDINQIISQKSQ